MGSARSYSAHLVSSVRLVYLRPDHPLGNKVTSELASAGLWPKLLSERVIVWRGLQAGTGPHFHSKIMPYRCRETSAMRTIADNTKHSLRSSLPVCPVHAAPITLGGLRGAF